MYAEHNVTQVWHLWQLFHYLHGRIYKHIAAGWVMLLTYLTKERKKKYLNAFGLVQSPVFSVSKEPSDLTGVAWEVNEWKRPQGLLML